MKKPKKTDSEIDKEYSEELYKRVCPECHTSLLDQHPEHHGQVKCRTCGFTKVVPSTSTKRTML